MSEAGWSRVLGPCSWEGPAGGQHPRALQWGCGVLVESVRLQMHTHSQNTHRHPLLTKHPGYRFPTAHTQTPPHFHKQRYIDTPTLTSHRHTHTHSHRDTPYTHVHTGTQYPSGEEWGTAGLGFERHLGSVSWNNQAGQGRPQAAPPPPPPPSSQGGNCFLPKAPNLYQSWYTHV